MQSWTYYIVLSQRKLYTMKKNMDCVMKKIDKFLNNKKRCVNSLLVTGNCKSIYGRLQCILNDVVEPWA